MSFGTVNILYLGGGVFSVPWLVLYKVIKCVFAEECDRIAIWGELEVWQT